MTNDIFHGILSGIFGPVIARLALKFKYRTIFAFVVIGLYLVAFANSVRLEGWRIACSVFMDKITTPVGVLVPPGIGLLVVACVFVASSGESENKR
ncbi:hypothetical protein GCM10027093_33750 [Paraburkholderia jirisanensis]